MTIIGIIIVVIIATNTDFTLVLCIGDREGLGTRWNGGDHKKLTIYEYPKPSLSSRGCVQSVSWDNEFLIVLLFYYHFAIHIKYTDKIVKKTWGKGAQGSQKGLWIGPP